MSSDTDISRRAVLASALAAPALIASPVSASGTGPLAGPFSGFKDGPVSAFLGIRYGSAARFRLPQIASLPPTLTTARGFAPIAPQRGASRDGMSEDCHFLNIWTPSTNSGARLPVMVYFHGGAYTSGSVTNPLTHGQHLAAREDVVVVTVNHRLNALGYAWLSPFGERFKHSGNLGQLDLICALQWIKRHIALFGGDPGRVMVFGQSGGGAKIATLMAMPDAAGLFHTAATMSGQQVTAQGPANALERTRAFLAAVGLDESQVHQLEDLALERIIEGLDASDPFLPGRVYFGPVLDMVHLHRHPFWPDAAPQSRHIPMILGNTTDETRAFIDPDGPIVRGLSWGNIAERLRPQIRIDLPSDWVVDQYRQRFPKWTPQEVFYAASTDGRSWPGQLIEAEARARASRDNTWVYQLDRPSPINPKRGAAHTDDLPYVFGTLDAPGSYSGTNHRSREIRDEMMRAFAGLARSGRPAPDGWDVYAVPSRKTLVIGEERSVVADDPRAWQRRLWSKAPYIQPGS